jgi:CubicO group peptidase (beta-lactamase class C family)
MKRFARLIRLGWLPMLTLLAPALSAAQLRTASPTEQALDAEAFQGMDQAIADPPVSMPYGYLWWVLPTEAPRRTFMASGYGGQTIWVHPPLELVIATSATASVESQRRGQAVQLLRTRLFAAAQKRYASVER